MHTPINLIPTPYNLTAPPPKEKCCVAAAAAKKYRSSKKKKVCRSSKNGIEAVIMRLDWLVKKSLCEPPRPLRSLHFIF
jgi:hypothetical protein